jgi:hypothetical protein
MQNYKTVDGASWMKAKKSRLLSHSDCFGSPRFYSGFLYNWMFGAVIHSIDGKMRPTAALETSSS